MKKISALLAVAIAALAFAGSPAQATEKQSGLTNAVGLMVKYIEGVTPIAPNGEPTGENFAGVNLSQSRDIGNGFRALDFDSPMNENSARRIVAALERDPRIQSVDIDFDFLISPQSVAARSQEQLAVALGTVFKASSAPLSVKLNDAWVSSAPTTARVKVSWLAPKTLNGGKLAGFQIWRSLNGSSYSLATTVVSSKARFAYLTTGLVAGSSTRIIVKAITKVGTAIKYGLPSKSVGLTPTAKPIAPRLNGYSDDQITKPKWTQLTLAERGGLPVSYRLTATAPGKPTLSCVTTSTTCQLVGFSADSNYSLRVTATNSRGSSSSLVALRPREPYFYQQWYLYADYGINAPAAWSQLPAAYENQVVVAVIDTGITSHADLDSQVVPGYDFVSQGQNPNDGDGWDADASDPGNFSTNPVSSSTWHGTHVAGLIGAAANGSGITGVAPGVKIQPVRALGGLGGKSSDLVAAVTWASGGVVSGVPLNETPAKVVNISMGTALATNCDAPLQAAFTAAIARGVTILTAAGNGDASNNPMLSLNSYPGNCFGSITVGATNGSGTAAYYSNYGVGVDISAPGGDDRTTLGTPSASQGMLLSTFNTGSTIPAAETYAFNMGTSMATPLVSGAVALLYAKSADMTPDLVWELLLAGVKKFKPGSQCALTVGSSTQRCGAGILDIGASLKLVK
jgi:serine protease